MFYNNFYSDGLIDQLGGYDSTNCTVASKSSKAEQILRELKPGKNKHFQKNWKNLLSTSFFH